MPEKSNIKENPLAVLVSRDQNKTKKVLQRPTTLASRQGISLTVDVIDYDESGKLRLLGRANAENKIYVYLNNTIIGNSNVSMDGFWELQPENTVASGLYLLRVDELFKGKVFARIEIPFSRAVPLLGLKRDEYVIVQPGNSLWRISRRALGRGTLYSVIYDANKDQIRDADLIFPGQIFAIPKRN